VQITIRHAEPDDYEALHRIFSGPRVIADTLQLPLPSAEMWRKRVSEKPENLYSLVACADGEVVGNLGLETQPTRWRRRHVGQIGMAVRDDWQGKGIGTALMEAALDLADNWLNLTRVELSVFTENAAAIALSEKCGFEVEGTHRRYAFRNGAYVDSYSMARVRG
jgi:putative acetyltransferase